MTSRFPPLAPTGCCSPTSSVLSRRYDALPPSRRTSFPSLGGTSVPLVVFALCQTSALPEPGVGDPVSPSGTGRGASRALPSSWGTSMIRSPCSNPTPAGLLVSDRCDTAAWPLVCKKQRLPRKVFRSSIAWHSDWLSTLRSADHSNPTQDSLPVAGQALLGGVSTHMVPLKGFKGVDYISSSFPKLCLAQLHRPRRLGLPTNSQRCHLAGYTSASSAEAESPSVCPAADSNLAENVGGLSTEAARTCAHLM